MGGQSFKCPLCLKWFFKKQACRDHLVDYHHVEKGFTLDGVAEFTHVVRERDRARTCTPTDA